MDPVAWFLKIPPDPRSPNSSTSSPSSGVGSMLSSIFPRSSVRPSGPDGKPRQKLARNVSWNPHVEVWRPTSRSVTWSTQVEVFIIPARECALPGNDSVSSAVAREVPVEDAQSLLAPDAVGRLQKGADLGQNSSKLARSVPEWWPGERLGTT